MKHKIWRCFVVGIGVAILVGYIYLLTNNIQSHWVSVELVFATLGIVGLAILTAKTKGTNINWGK